MLSESTDDDDYLLARRIEEITGVTISRWQAFSLIKMIEDSLQAKDHNPSYDNGYEDGYRDGYAEAEEEFDQGS